MQTRWHIQLFGALQAQHGDLLISRFRTRKTGLLLACLACHLPRARRREELMEQLWPESDPDTARTQLRHQVYLLRRLLEPPGTPAGTVLVADRTSLRLNPAGVTTDVSAFEGALAAAKQAEGSREQVTHLTQAVELYRGELLPGCFEDWVQQERQWLTERFFQALGALLSHLEQAGEVERAVEYARQGVRADPLREEAHRDLIRLQAAAGQQEAALRQYEELKRRLARELADEPSAELRALAATLRKPCSLASIPLSTEAPLSPVSSASRSSLPLPLDRFFGRRPELARLIALLRPLTAAASDEEQLEESAPPRLITLTGPGGSGKTRLALEVARRLQPRSRAPIWFVPLQGLTPSASTDTGGAAMRPPILEEVRDALRLPRTPEADPLEQVVLAFSEQPALLILDNFEHLVEGGAPLVQALLQRVATLTVLVASRRRLNLPGEQEFPVLPLPVPATGGSDPWAHRGEAEIPVSADKSAAVSLTVDLDRCSAAVLPLTSNPSIQLFIDRAQQARADFALTPSSAADVARLCARLEGIPLAIELAAGRAGVLTPRQILERLSDPFALLVSRRSGVEERHHSLRATLDWSYRLLPTELQQFFTYLSIFRGGWTLEAAAAVCQTTEALEYLEQLRECSLIVVEEAKGEIRYRLLETLREYGAERLAPAEQDALAERHAAFFLALAEQAELRMHSPERYGWLARLEPERDNMRAALAWCLEAGVQDSPSDHRNTRTPEHLTMGLRLAAALAEFWAHSGHAGEGRDWLQRLLERAVGLGRSAVRARALGAAGYLAGKQYDEAGAKPLLEESIAVWRELADPAGLVQPLCLLGLWNVYQREFAPARALLEECVALARALGDRWTLAAAIDNLGRLSEFEGDLARARAYLEEARMLNPEVGAEETLASILYRLGCVALAEGHLEEAREWYEQSMVVTRMLPAADQTCSLRELGQVERLRGNYAEARIRLEECLALRQRLGHTTYLPSALSQLADVVLCQGDFAAARALAERGLALARAGADPSFTVGLLRVLGRAAYQQGELAQARKRLEEALSCAGERGRPLVSIDLAEVLAGLGEYAQARALFAQSLTALRPSRNHLGLSHLLRAQGRFELRQGEWQQAAPSYRESLSLLQERGVREGVPDCLEGLAGVALAAGVGEAASPADGQPATCEKQGYRLLGASGCVAGARFAARLLGAAEALRESMGAPLPPVYWSDHERMVAWLHTALSEEELVAEWTEGKAMSAEQATAAALASLEPADSGGRAAGAAPKG